MHRRTMEPSKPPGCGRRRCRRRNFEMVRSIRRGRDRHSEQRTIVRPGGPTRRPPLVHAAEWIPSAQPHQSSRRLLTCPGEPPVLLIEGTGRGVIAAPPSPIGSAQDRRAQGCAQGRVRDPASLPSRDPALLRGPAGLCGDRGLIGAAGFEPATFRPPAERATKLRHAPGPPSLREPLSVGGERATGLEPASFSLEG
jgi:hypothetical protein